ncbi:TPA: glycosyltransferase [Streptococcus suis]
MIRVLHYVGRMDRGGMQALIMNLYRNIDRSEIQFDFAIHGTNNGDFEKEIVAMGGEFYQFPIMRSNPLAYRKKWREFWSEHANDYSAFHMHNNSLANIIALEEAARANVPIRIIHSHSSFANRGHLQILNNFLHRLHRNKLNIVATHCITCSDRAAEWMYGGMKIGSKDVILLKNGVDINKYKFSEEIRKSKRDELKAEEGELIIGQVGSFLPVKNHEFSLKLAKELKNRGIAFKFIFFGDGPLLDSIIKKAEELEILDETLFVGKRSDVAELLSAMDIYVMPSLYEGLPVSLVEAQVNGVTSIVSDSITKTVAFNDNLHYKSIDTVDEWADLICQGAYAHEANIKKIVENGFDIMDTCRIYREIIMNEGIN